jgi:hypothetical protein
MFTTERVAALLKRVTLDTIELKEETRRIANCNFAIEPLPYDLAREIGTDVADHLFRVHRNGGSSGEPAYEVRSEIDEIAFKVDTAKFYIMDLFGADDRSVPASVHVSTCFCQKLKVKRDKTSPILRAEFTSTFEIDDPGVLWRCVNQWHSKDKTFVTFIETEPPLNFDDDAANDADDRRDDADTE